MLAYYWNYLQLIINIAEKFALEWEYCQKTILVDTSQSLSKCEQLNVIEIFHVSISLETNNIKNIALLPGE